MRTNANPAGGFSLSTGFRLTQLAMVLSVVLASFVLFGCAPTQVRQKAGHHEPQQAVSVLLMPIDIELSALTAGGVKEVRADWTETAKALVSDALTRQMAQHNDRLVEYVAPQNPEELQEHAQIAKIHALVGQTILVYSILPAAVPPTKKDVFDWSLGNEVTKLRETTGADYALFVYIRDSYATAGRKALMVTSALLGVGVTGGSQIGFSTLVDLRDGSVVWFNRIARQTGDLRTEAPAYSAVAELLQDIPL
jgi:hypothetical protein